MLKGYKRVYLRNEDSWRSENWSEYQKCILVSWARLILDCNTVKHGQNQLICHFALKTCHISSENGYISETKLDVGLKIGQNIRNAL